MKLYHGSYCRIAVVDLGQSKKYKDFGAGFYLTPVYGRAVTMAFRSVELNDAGTPEVNPFIFNMSTCPPDLKIKVFKTNNWEWADFVMMNRDKTLDPPYDHGYDVIIGPVADSSVDREIEAYRQEFGENYRKPENLKELSRRLKYSGEKYTQYCFCTERAIQQLIRD